MFNTLSGFWLVALSGALGLVTVGGMFLFALLRRPPNQTAARRVIAGLAIMLFNYFLSLLNGPIFNIFDSVSVDVLLGVTSLIRAVIGLVAIGLIVSAAYVTAAPSQVQDEVLQVRRPIPPSRPQA